MTIAQVVEEMRVQRELKAERWRSFRMADHTPGAQKRRALTPHGDSKTLRGLAVLIQGAGVSYEAQTGSASLLDNALTSSRRSHTCFRTTAPSVSGTAEK